MKPTSKCDENVPEFGTRLDGKVCIERPGVYAIIENSEGKIAAIETGTGYFLPGGGMDPGETEVEALDREIMEETGHQVSQMIELGTAVEYIHAPREEKYYRITGKFYIAMLGPKIREGIEEDHRLVWLSKEDALKRLARQSQSWAVRNLPKA